MARMLADKTAFNDGRLQCTYTAGLMQGIVFDHVYKDLTLFFFATLFGIVAFFS
jgi:hypothetical protein